MVKGCRDSKSKSLEGQTLEKQIKLFALKGNWNEVYRFLEYFVTLSRADEKNKIGILLASEEIFVNISSYAYPGSIGSVKVSVKYVKGSRVISILFEDWGIPFNPLSVDKPELDISPSKRKVGGLGIFIVRNIMDHVEYEYAEGKNRFLIIKNLNNNQGGEINGSK